MSTLDTLMESEDFQNYMVEHQELFMEAEQKVNDFSKVLKSFVIANSKEFLAENIDQTVKNIRVFAEIATHQYTTELSSMMSYQLASEDPNSITEDSKDEYF